MHVIKILYMASIYELVTEIKRTIKKNIFTAIFTKKPLQNNFLKKYSNFTAVFT
jgi:hypothetical protein